MRKVVHPEVGPSVSAGHGDAVDTECLMWRPRRHLGTRIRSMFLGIFKNDAIPDCIELSCVADFIPVF